jgi:septal ring factor EnvC (AmiA/AmiB activator)
MAMTGWQRTGIFLLPALLVFSLMPGAAFSESEKDVKERYRGVQKEIKSKEARLKRAEKVEDITLKDIDELDRRLHSVSRELKKHRRELGKTRKDVSLLEGEVARLREKLEFRRRVMKRKLRAMHRYEKFGDALLVLGAAGDIPQIMRRWRYLESLARHEGEMVRGYNDDLRELGRRQARLHGLERKLAAEEEQVLRNREKLAARKKEKQRLLASVRREKESFERVLKDLRKSSARLAKLMREYEASSAYAPSADFRKLKGRLPWPVPGLVSVPYGSQKDPRFNTAIFRNGITIEGDEDELARAVHGGKVVYADWFKGYGQLVIVNHGGGYHTLYANLSDIFLKTGDIIDNKTQIGRIGTSGLVDRPSLYFEIRYKGKPLNPSQWLKRR